MEKAFVLDTNVLIHDPKAIFQFADNRVVIPIHVIEELDKLKTLHDEKGMNARWVTRAIDDIRKKGNLADGSPMPSGGTLQIWLDFKAEDNLGLNPSIMDNRITFCSIKCEKAVKKNNFRVKKTLMHALRQRQ